MIQGENRTSDEQEDDKVEGRKQGRQEEQHRRLTK
jgi:hypothetical protein